MGRACLSAAILISAGLAFGAGTADANEARPPQQAVGVGPSAARDTATKSEKLAGAAAERRRTVVKPKSKDKARAAAPAPKARQPAPEKRRPVAAAAAPAQPPQATAAARAKELERRLDLLLPGTKLGAAIEDRENPSWRRARAGVPSGENNGLSLPFDEAGKAGFLARGYHAQPDVQNPHGNTGATFGLRQRF